MPTIGMPSFDQLRVLIAVVEAGSFTGAARRLRRAQSVISYTVRQLEAELGLAVFDRAGRVPVLTEAGRGVLREARRIERQMDELRAGALASRQGFEAELPVAVDVMFPVCRLVVVLRGFAAQFPTVVLRLRLEALGGVVRLVRDGICQLGVSGWVGDRVEALDRRSIGAIRLLAVAAPGHPLACLSGRLTPAMLEDHTQLVLSDSSGLSDGQDFGVMSARTWRLSDLGAKHALLREGLGWGYMPEPAVAEDLAAGRLLTLAVAAAAAPRYEFSLIRRIDQPPGPAATWLGERLAETMHQGDWA